MGNYYIGLIIGLLLGSFLGGWLAESDIKEQAIAHKLAHWELKEHTNIVVFKWNDN